MVRRAGIGPGAGGLVGRLDGSDGARADSAGTFPGQVELFDLILVPSHDVTRRVSGGLAELVGVGADRLSDGCDAGQDEIDAGEELLAVVVVA